MINMENNLPLDRITYATCKKNCYQQHYNSNYYITHYQNHIDIAAVPSSNKYI